MTRQLTITAAEWASVHDGTLWLVREGDVFVSSQRMTSGSNLPGTYDGPPAKFVEACAPCETCGDHHSLWHIGTVKNGRPSEWRPCPDCRIELVGPCQTCDGRGWTVEGKCWGQPEGEQVQCDCAYGIVTLGHAYAIGQPLPIVRAVSVHDDLVAGRATPWPNIQMSQDGEILSLLTQRPLSAANLTDRLAHAGPPESLVGKWALQVRVIGRD